MTTSTPSPDESKLCDLIRTRVGELIEPKLNWKLADLNLIREVSIDADCVNIAIDLVTEEPAQIQALRDSVYGAVEPSVGDRRIEISHGRVNIATKGVDGIGRILLIASGKGGVGKSSVATNLAIALSQAGYRVGLMDADIYGPSLPTMLGVRERPEVLPDEYLLPISVHGIQTMSVGYLVEPATALDWRGNLASGTILQFIQRTFWNTLDYLIVDLPPGTGDIQLSLAHQLKSDAALLVTTPQEVALDDVRRSIDLLRRSEIPILGIVENMSFLVCEHCGEHNQPFSNANPTHLEDLGDEIPCLGRIPLERAIAVAGDAGRPLVLDTEAPEVRQAFRALAGVIVERLPALVRSAEHSAPVRTPRGSLAPATPASP
jgi:ATP-binding protein involved in chromosome partitioning